MKTISFLLSFFLLINILFGQITPIEQYLSLDNSEYRGIDLVPINDTSLLLLGQVNLWDSSYTGFPISGALTTGYMVSRYQIQSQDVDISRYFSIIPDNGFRPVEEVVHLGSINAIPVREPAGILACEEDTLTGKDSDKLRFLILDENLQTQFDSLTVDPWCQSYSILHCFTQENDGKFISVIKSHFIDSLFFITMNKSGKIENLNSHYFPYSPNSTHITHDEKGISLIQTDDLRFERFSLYGDFRYAKTGLSHLSGPDGVSSVISLGNGDVIFTTDSLTRIDSMGNTIWAVKWPDSFFKPRDMIQLPGNGDMIAVGKVMEQGADYRKIYLFRFSTDGTFYQSNYYGDEYDTPNSIKLLPDGRVAVVGGHLVLPYELDPNPGTLYLLITNPPDQALDIESVPNEVFSVFPNPFEETVQIEYQGIVKGEVEITLYDLTGRKVFEKNEVVSQPGEVYKSMINPGPIPAGMYNLVFRVGDLRIVRRVIKE